jgi:hypothetical protein
MLFVNASHSAMSVRTKDISETLASIVSRATAAALLRTLCRPGAVPGRTQ